MSTTLDAPGTTADEAEEHDEEQDEQPGPDPDGKGLFDRSQYEREDLALPKIGGPDGEPVDKIRVKFSGSVLLDRSNPADVALYRRLQLGREVELRTAGKVTSDSGGYTTNREGDLDAVVGIKTVTVGTVWVLDPEDL